MKTYAIRSLLLAATVNLAFLAALGQQFGWALTEHKPHGGNVKIIIETIDHADQRYPTVGDWTLDKDGTITVHVSRLTDDRYEFLVGLHEAIEAFLCVKRGVSQAAVDEFDMQYEKDREAGKHSDDDEPGDDPTAPYYAEHQFAFAIETLAAQQLGVVWKDYEEAIKALE